MGYTKQGSIITNTDSGVSFSALSVDSYHYQKYKKWVDGGGDVYYVDDDAAVIHSKALADLKTQRKNEESKGVVYDGMLFKTDSKSRSDFIGTALAFYMGLKTTENWKCENGWYVLTSENYINVAIAVLGHVSAAFTWEMEEINKLEVE